MFLKEFRIEWTRTRLWLWTTPPPPFFVGDRRPEKLPHIIDGTEIQQTRPSDPAGTPPFFVSLFDKKRNIPIYSAYKVTPQQAAGIGTYNRVDAKWRDPPGTKLYSIYPIFFH